MISLCLVLLVVILTSKEEESSVSLLGPRTVLRCLHVLTDMNWDEIATTDIADTGETQFGCGRSFGAIMHGVIYGEFCPADMILYRLWERQNYLVAQQKCDDMYQAHLPGKPSAEARNLAVSQYVQEVTEKRADDESGLTPENIREAIHLILRRAARWMTLVTTFSIEILLVNQRKQLLRDNVTLGNVFEDGTDEEFEELLRFLLNPANRVRETCLLLSGVSKMIIDLADASPNSEIRQYLGSAVKLRVQDIFGEPVDFLNKTPAEREIHNRPPQRYINAIFGIKIITRQLPSAGKERHPNSSQS